MPVKKIVLYFVLLTSLLYSCSRKKVLEGSITYDLHYQLPDSLKRYQIYLPKTAKVYFKGDSAVSIQQMNDESTTIITHKPTNFMRVLLTSRDKKIVIDYSKADQEEESTAKLGYSYVASVDTQTIAHHKALKYVLTNKVTGETDEAWFTKEVHLIPNSLTATLDTAKGFPLSFTTSTNGLWTKTTVKEIKFEPVPAGIFSTPAGYEKLTPKQLREMPVEN